MVLSGLNECYKKGLLRKVEPSESKSDMSMSEALNWLEEARRNVDADALRSAISSSYNAAFHAARAVLFRDGVREKSHFCVGEYLATYVEKGFIEREWIILFDRMRSNRHSQQYSFKPPPSTEEVETLLDASEDLVERIEGLLRSTSLRDRPELD